ncbi:MAG: hypothetical protein IKK59_06265 [Lachnospiraceae bacterium]|nr:hypothetical protein [Lachnospiraceae bacterium]
MLKRKDKGILDQFLPAIVVIVLLAVLWTGSMVSASNIDRSSDIQQVARTYLLRMETDGRLTEENRNLLIAELEALDMEQIDLTGTSFTNVGYGNRIRLVIRGVVNLSDIDFKGFASPMMTQRQAEVAIEKISVAKN